VTLEKSPQFVHVVSHGPHCLDGVTAAVAVSRYYRTATVQPHFSSNAKINETLLALRCEPPDARHEVWITDISWTDPAVDRHLQDLIEHGVRVYWIDHHRTALERYRNGEVAVQLTDHVLSEECAASRLTYEYLRDRLARSRETNEWFAALHHLVALADDNDRWIHQVPGSRQLALTIGVQGLDAYRELLHIDAQVTYTPRMREAAERVEAEVRRSFEVAERSRTLHRLPRHHLNLVTAVCDGHPSEIADAWGKTASHTVFALFDAQSLTVSLRRSADCTVDLSHLARHLGGGGHAAAAGCEVPALLQQIAQALATTIAGALEQTHAPDANEP
jgi:oligoribonuclease NrnB/cAMP/cGMP phosphodiesterase (DHH superfamily)